MKKERFTMIELLIVIGIIGILAALILSRLSGGVDASNRAKAKAEMAAQVTALINKEATGQEVTDLGKDPWGNAYSSPTYNEDFERWEIKSNGPDGKSGTKDDIYSWKD